MANSNTSPIMICAKSLHHGGYYAQVDHPLTPSEFRVFGIAVNPYGTSRIGMLSNYNIEN